MEGGYVVLVDLYLRYKARRCQGKLKISTLDNREAKGIDFLYWISKLKPLASLQEPCFARSAVLTTPSATL